MGSHPLEQVQTIAVRQAHVGQAQVESLGLEQFLGTGHVTGRLRAELHASQRQRDQFDQVGFIINDEYERWRHLDSLLARSGHPAFGITEHDTEQAPAAGARLVQECRAVGLCQFAGQE